MRDPIVRLWEIGKALAVLSGILYIVCLATPAYHPSIGYAEAGVYYGWAALLLGPVGLFGGHFSWLANPLLWCSWITFRKNNYRVAFAYAVVAIAMALTFLRGETIPVGSSGNYPYEILFGYYIWLTSIGFAGAAARVRLYAHSQQHGHSAP